MNYFAELKVAIAMPPSSWLTGRLLNAYPPYVAAAAPRLKPRPTSTPTVSPTTGFITGGDPLDGVVIPGSGFPSAAKGHVPDNILNGGYQRLFRGYDSGYSPTVYSDIQPRLGFAWQLNPGTVLRAGAGRYVQRLGISDQTVKFHVSAISGKLGAANRTDAVRRAVRRGLITF